MGGAGSPRGLSGALEPRLMGRGSSFLNQMGGSTDPPPNSQEGLPSPLVNPKENRDTY